MASTVGIKAHIRRASSRNAPASMSCTGRSPSCEPAIDTALRSTSSSPPPPPLPSATATAVAGSTSASAAGSSRRRRGRGPERPGLFPVGQAPLEHEEPHVLEAAARGQLRGRVLAVVVEAFLATDVADARLRHDEALEPSGHLGGRLAHGPQLGEGDEVADRHHADELAVLHDRQVAVVVVGQAAPRRARLLLGAEHIRVGGHPRPDPVDGRPAGHRPQYVALGQDADHLARRVALDHHDGPDLRPAHGVGCLADRDLPVARDGRGRHEVTDERGHGASWRCPPAILVLPSHHCKD